MARRSLGAANAAPGVGSDEALEGSQPGDVAAGEMPSPEARKPSLHQRLPVGMRQRTQSAAVALFKRAKGRASGSSSQEPASVSAEADAARSRSAAERPRSSSQPDNMPGQATASIVAVRRPESTDAAEAGSDAERAAKRRRTDMVKGADSQPLNPTRFVEAARLTSADRTVSDASAAFSSQEPDDGGPLLLRNGSSLGSRRHGAAGLKPKGGGNGRRRLSSEGSAAAPITSLIEVCRGAALECLAPRSWSLGMMCRACKHQLGHSRLAHTPNGLRGSPLSPPSGGPQMRSHSAARQQRRFAHLTPLLSLLLSL